MAFVLFDVIDRTYRCPEDVEEMWQEDEEKAVLFPTEEAAQRDWEEIDVEEILLDRVFPRWTERRIVYPWRRVDMTHKERMDQLEEEWQEHVAQRLQWRMKQSRVFTGVDLSSTGRASSTIPLQTIASRYMKPLPLKQFTNLEVDYKGLEERIRACAEKGKQDEPK